MEDEGDFSKWDELLPDALGLIFKKLSLKEVLAVVPVVCKSWGRAVMGPYCWQEIDIEEWSRDSKPEIVEQLLQMLITRSCGSIRKLAVSGLTDQSISFISDHAQSLQALRLPRSQIKDVTIEKAAGKLLNLTYLDLSYCIGLGARALETIGKTCKMITTLKRVMHPLEVINKLCQNDEAHAIATTMPKLKHLEISYLLVDTPNVIEILQNCKQLELLDVRGCWNLNLDETLMKKFPRVKLVGPLIVDHCYYNNIPDNWSENSGSSGYLAWDFVADDVDDDYAEMWEGIVDEDGDEDEVEMWFYDDINDSGYDWPQSP